MNYEDGYRSMLGIFRTNDLQTLLGAFGRNRAGRKSELKERALELLRNGPQPGFNFQAYCSKITEIYGSMQNDVPNNDSLRNLMQNQQRQMINMQNQPPRMFLPPQYPQQHLARAGLPQVMPQMSRGMYGNNMGTNNSNIQYFNQPNLSRNIHQMPANQQLNYIMPDPMAYNRNVSGNNNTYNQPLPPSLNNIRFRRLPFFEILGEVIRPTILNGQDRCTLPNNLRDKNTNDLKGKSN